MKKRRYKRNCRKCGADFLARTGSCKTCSECVVSVCDNCGDQFKTHFVGTTGEYQRFCSLKCRSLVRWRGKRKIVPCCTCGMGVSKALSWFAKHKSNLAFCGSSCKARYFWKDADIRAKMIGGIKKAIAKDPEKRKKQLDEARLKIEYPIREETRKLIRKARMKQHFPVQMTSIEKILHDEFLRRNLEFVMHKPFLGKYQPDFTFEKQKIFVQADGEYWHSRPERIRGDKVFNKLAVAHGWLVIRFSEIYININPRGCGRHVQDSIGMADGTLTPENDRPLEKDEIVGEEKYPWERGYVKPSKKKKLIFVSIMG